MHPIAYLLRNPRAFAFAVASLTGTASLIGIAVHLNLRRRLTPQQREELRRNRLVTTGRMIDGTLIETAFDVTAPVDAPPYAIIYRYRVGGVTYECGQDVTCLTSHLPPLGEGSALLGSPIQVRYDRDNPADSIIVAETWNGLWNGDQTHSDPHH